MQVIKYIGLAHRRVISAEEWAAAGVTGMGTVEWSYMNNFSVPIDHFTDDALRVAIEPDNFFIVSGGDDPRELFRRRPRITPQEADRPEVDMMARVTPVVGSGASSGGPTGATTTGTGSGSD